MLNDPAQSRSLECPVQDCLSYPCHERQLGMTMWEVLFEAGLPLGTQVYMQAYTSDSRDLAVAHAAITLWERDGVMPTKVVSVRKLA